jgi:imidazolonepropionase-like amidohydrolase
MPGIVFHNVNIFDGAGPLPGIGAVRVEGSSIVELGANVAALGGVADRLIDGGGRTLMPGLVEAHAHLSWPSSVERMVPRLSLPPEDLILSTARNARILLDHGYTSAYSAGSLSKTIEVTLNSFIQSGGMPGPRLIASSIEREPPTTGAFDGGKVDPHGSGPEAVRAFVRECATLGAKSVKFCCRAKMRSSRAAHRNCCTRRRKPMRPASRHASRACGWRRMRRLRRR